MLVCPKCQYKNPINHKFCQKCGTSLTQKVCPECDTQISLSALTCHHCGAKTGKTLWGIILPKTNPITPSEVVPSEYESTEVETEELFAINSPILNQTDISSETNNTDVLSAFEVEENTPASQVVREIGQPDEETKPIEAEPSTNIEETEDTMAGAVVVEAAETVTETVVEDVLTPQTPETTETPVTETSATETPVLETPATGKPDFSIAPGDYLDDRQRYQLISQIGAKTPSGAWQGAVLDCQPLQISPLLTSISAASSSSRSASTTVIQTSIMLIPAIAQPYLQLRNQWAPIIPLIHDAWENQDYSILLIEDRSNLPRLIDQCHQLTQVEPLDLQPFIQWFKQMTQLWQVLTPLKCRQSLLNIDNLLVDQISGGLRLQRLYGDATTAPKLAELGKIWQQLLPIDSNDSVSSHPEIIQRINDVVNDVVNEKILTPDKLLATIQAVNGRNATAIAHPSDNNDEISHGDDLSTIAMTQGLRNLEAIGATDVGQQRNHNEDDFAIQTEIFKSQTSRDRSLQFRGIYIVCDGMGGHDGGEVASAQAVKTLQEYFGTHWQDPLTLPDEATIRQGILEANQAIYDLNQEEVRSGSGRMGTTLVMALVNQNEIAVAHVGDSRLYRLTKTQRLQQLTVDHEVGQREIQRGIDPEIAYSRPDAYQLTQALGPRPENFVQPDVQFFPIEENSLFILASDGLTDNDLLENHISTHLEPLLNSDSDLNQGVKNLIALANDYNGHDNITAIAIRAMVQQESNQQESNQQESNQQESN
jgi:protein phosphatase